MADTPETPPQEPTEAPATAPAEPTAAAPAEPAAAAEPAATAAAPATSDMGPAACAAALAQHFPALFGAEQPPRPLKLRIQQDIQQRAPGVFSRRALGVFFHRHTTSTPYLKALVASDARYDLDAQPAGEMAAEHKEAAQVELARRKALADERRAALRDAQRQAQRAQRPAAAPAAAPAPGPDGDAPPPRPARHARPPQPPRPARAQRQERPPRQEHADRPARPPRPPQALREAPREAAAPPEPSNPALREQTHLVRAWQGSTLTKANFCVLKRITEAELDAAIALVQPAPRR